jgi:hypothetical protein
MSGQSLWLVDVLEYVGRGGGDLASRLFVPRQVRIRGTPHVKLPHKTDMRAYCHQLQ